MAPDHAVALKEDAPGWAELDSGIWFQCTCGRIGHISELLYVDDETTMLWCPKCKKDNWRWTDERNRKNANIKATKG